MEEGSILSSEGLKEEVSVGMTTVKDLSCRATKVYLGAHRRDWIGGLKESGKKF